MPEPWKPPSRLDPECLALCEALNSIPSLETHESCCGHGRDSFRIWFRVHRLRNLFVVLRAIERRYCGPPEWRCEGYCGDMEEYAVSFELTSRSVVGEEAYLQSRLIAGNIGEILAWPELLEMFDIRG